MAKIFVTGTSGFCGRHIVDYFRAKKHSVLSHYGRASSDLGNPKHNFALPESVDVLIHTAAISPAPDVSDIEIVKNVQIMQNLAAYAAGKGQVKKIIFFSSLSLYGEFGFAQDHTLRIDSPRINPSVYGETKHICEEILRATGIPTVSLRLPAVLGCGSRRHWPAQILEAGRLGREVVVYNPNRPYNNVVHIQYLCELIETLIQKGWEHRLEVFWPLLLASAWPITTREAVDLLVPDSGLIKETAAFRNNFIVDTGTIDQILPLWSTAKTLRQYAEDERNTL